MLTKMAGQILNLEAELKEFADFGMANVEASVTKVLFERVVLVFVFPRPNQGGKASKRFRIERQRFTNFAGGRAAAVGDHVGGHRRAQSSVTFVDVLDGAFALIAAG